MGFAKPNLAGGVSGGTFQSTSQLNQGNYMPAMGASSKPAMGSSSKPAIGGASKPNMSGGSSKPNFAGSNVAKPMFLQNQNNEEPLRSRTENLNLNKASSSNQV